MSLAGVGLAEDLQNSHLAQRKSRFCMLASSNFLVTSELMLFCIFTLAQITYWLIRSYCVQGSYTDVKGDSGLLQLYHIKARHKNTSDYFCNQHSFFLPLYLHCSKFRYSLLTRFWQEMRFWEQSPVKFLLSTQNQRNPEWK